MKNHKPDPELRTSVWQENRDIFVVSLLCTVGTGTKRMLAKVENPSSESGSGSADSQS
jgi:hypothetical protein